MPIYDIHPEDINKSELVKGFPTNYYDVMEAYENNTGKKWEELEPEEAEFLCSEMENLIIGYISDINLYMLMEEATEMLEEEKLSAQEAEEAYEREYE